MAEATPTEGTSLLSTAAAVDLLLGNEAPETEKVEEREELAAEEENAPEPQTETEDDEVEEAESDEDDSEDIDEDEAEEEDETEDAQVEEVEEPSETTYTVRVGDEEIDVPLSELTNSYMRQSDYTRKTQQLAEARKTAEAELENVTGERQRYADQLTVLEEALSQQEPPQQYWDQLHEEDPLEYSRQRDLARDRKDAIEQVAAEKERTRQAQLAQLQADAQKRLGEEHERIKELIPEWLDDEVAAREKSAVVTYAQSQGYTPEELSQVSDARAVSMIRKAFLYDELMQNKPVAQKKTKKAPKMTKSGQPRSKKQTSERRRAKALANIGDKRGSSAIDAAVDYLTT